MVVSRQVTTSEIERRNTKYLFACGSGQAGRQAGSDLQGPIDIYTGDHLHDDDDDDVAAR